MQMEHQINELKERKAALKKELDEVSERYQLLLSEHETRSNLQKIVHDLSGMGLHHLIAGLSAKEESGGYAFVCVDEPLSFDIWFDSRCVSISASVDVDDTAYQPGYASGSGPSFREAFLKAYANLVRLKNNTQEALDHLESACERIKPKV